MTRLKNWIVNRYLPAVARAAMEDEVKRLRDIVANQTAEMQKRQAYINGLLEGQKAARRVTINNNAQ